eukprot:6373281-Alexandrium_andersonii.AAC.1
MSASLVGSEMCIRDSHIPWARRCPQSSGPMGARALVGRLVHYSPPSKGRPHLESGRSGRRPCCRGQLLGNCADRPRGGLHVHSL